MYRQSLYYIMGTFSWYTQDTDKQILIDYDYQTTGDVYMLDNLGNEYKETAYEGYGVFGGKDFYVLMAEMNGFVDENPQKMREFAIFLEDTEGVLFPNLNAKSGQKWINKEPIRDPRQGQMKFEDDYDYNN